MDLCKLNEIQLYYFLSNQQGIKSDIQQTADKVLTKFHLAFRKRQKYNCTADAQNSSKKCRKPGATVRPQS